jgi:uncharacterized protein YqgC (DUF456 family)
MAAKFREICGIGLVAIGVLGLLLPVLPGIPIIVAGVALLGTRHPAVRSARVWLRKKGLWKRQKQRT